MTEQEARRIVADHRAGRRFATGRELLSAHVTIGVAEGREVAP